MLSYLGFNFWKMVRECLSDVLLAMENRMRLSMILRVVKATIFEWGWGREEPSSDIWSTMKKASTC